MFLQPQQFWRFHLGRDDAADVAQNLVAGFIDPIGLRDCPVIHPDDDIASRIARAADTKGISAAVEHHQRAGGVETDSPDGRRGLTSFLEDGADGFGAGCPNVGGGLFDDIASLVPDRDRLARRRQQRAVGHEHAGAGTGSADVNSDKSWLHGADALPRNAHQQV